jgi:hypothetical protein
MTSRKGLTGNLVNPRYSVLTLTIYSAVLAAALVTVLVVWQRRAIAGVLQTQLPQVRLAQEKVVDDQIAYRHDYTFTTNWFTWNIPIWEQALEPLKGREDLRYLEVGAYEGRSVLWMLENVLTDPSARATVVDVFDGPFKDRYFANIERSGAADKVESITGFSQVVLRQLPLNTFDVIYIDGSHADDDVLEDAVLSWRLLKEGGLLIFDDYRWFRGGPEGITELPKNAIDPFINCFKDHVEVIHNSYQLILRKRVEGDRAG